MRDVLGGWPRLPAPCYFDRVARADKSDQGCEGEALGEELWYSGVSTKTTSSEKTRLWGCRSGGKEPRERGPGCGRGRDIAKGMQPGLGSRWPPSRPLPGLWTARKSKLPSLSLCFLVFSPVTHFRVIFLDTPAQGQRERVEAPQEETGSGHALGNHPDRGTRVVHTCV